MIVLSVMSHPWQNCIVSTAYTTNTVIDRNEQNGEFTHTVTEFAATTSFPAGTEDSEIEASSPDRVSRRQSLERSSVENSISPSTIRTYFPETWLWNIEISE